MDKIKIAFSFDANFYYPAMVAIASLLENTKSQVKVYCLINDDVTEKMQKKLINFLQSIKCNSEVLFISIGKIFDNAYEIRGISKAAYSRLMLHRLLPSEDKVIYSDVDVLFKADLADVWQTDIDEYDLAAVKDICINTDAIWKDLENELDYWKGEMSLLKGKYYNSGFLLCNLKKWREAGFDNKLVTMSKNSYYYQDQDILNVLFRKVLFLLPKYCFMPKHNYMPAIKENIINQGDYYEAKAFPVIIHYAGRKPWDDCDVAAADQWWNHVKRYSELYKYFNKRQYERFWSLGGLKLFSKKVFDNKVCYYVLGIKITKKINKTM